VRAIRAANCSISSVSRYAISEKFLFRSAVHVLLVLAGIEERRGMVLAERVVRVHKPLRVGYLWRLDVPEGVVRDGVQDLVDGRLLKAVGEGVLYVLHEVVLLAVLEDGELLVKDVHILVLGEGSVLLHLVQQSNSKFIQVVLRGLKDTGVRVLGAFPLRFQFVLRGELNLGIDHLVENGTVFEAFGSGQGVESTLENGTARVALLLDLNYGFGRGVVIFSKRLFIIVELLIILLVDGVELGLSRFVVSHIHVLEKSLALFLVGLLKESFNLRLHLLLLLGIT
jgi:hypothetical protein